MTLFAVSRRFLYFDDWIWATATCATVWAWCLADCVSVSSTSTSRTLDSTRMICSSWLAGGRWPACGSWTSVVMTCNISTRSSSPCWREWLTSRAFQSRSVHSALPHRSLCTVIYLTRCSAIAERPRCRVRYSFAKKWKTGTGRQYFTDIIGLSSTMVRVRVISQG